jgi:uncharacterized protein (DUF952 family)
MSLIYHIAAGPIWAQAQRDGEYTMSTRDKTLAQEGFIHCSDASQVAGVANLFYPGERDLLLLVIDPERVTSRVQYDPVADQRFPHIYGPLNVDAVLEARPFAAGPDGTFRFTETLLSERAVVSAPPVNSPRSASAAAAAILRWWLDQGGLDRWVWIGETRNRA